MQDGVPRQARLSDSNANLVARALGLAGALAAATGAAWDRAGRSLLAPALLGLGDKKKQARATLPLLVLTVAATELTGATWLALARRLCRHEKIR